MKTTHFFLVPVSLLIITLGFMAGCNNPTGGGGGGGGGSTKAPWIYCGASAAKNISIINGTTNTRVGSIELGGRTPYHMAASIDGKKLYVTTDTNEVVVINTATNTISGLITIETPATISQTKSFGMAVTKDGKYLYFTCYDLSNQVRVDLQNNNTYEVIGTSMNNPKGLILNETGTIEFINDQDTIITYTTSPWVYKADVTGSGTPVYGFALKDGKVYAAAYNSLTGECYVLNSATGTIEELITAEGATNFVGVVSIPGMNKLYVAQKNTTGKLNIIDTSSTPTFESTIITGETFTMANPTYMAATTNGKYVYVMDISYAHAQLCVVDTDTDKVVAEIPVNPVQGEYDNNVVVVYK